MERLAASQSFAVHGLLVLGALFLGLGYLNTARADGVTPAPVAPSNTPAPPPAPPKDPAKEPVKPPEKTVAKKPAAPVVTCTLLTPEAPRGGRLEVEGKNFGKSPVVKINAQTTRTIERSGDRIAVQIPRKSSGGAVTVRAEGQDITCGTLTIIGTDR